MAGVCCQVGGGGDGCRAVGGDKDWNVNMGKLNGTQPDGEHQVAGGDGMHRSQGYGSYRMIGGSSHPPNWGSQHHC